MRIAYLCFDAGIPVYGSKGASIHLRSVVNGLSRRGHSVRVFATSTEGADGELLDVRDVTLAPDHPAHLLGAEAALPSHLAQEVEAIVSADGARRDLLAQVRDFGPDVVYERYSLFGHGGASLASALDVPFLLEVNAPLCDEQTAHRELVLADTAREMEHAVLTGADKVLVVSPALAEHAARLGVRDESVVVVPNAVDPDLFDPAVDGEAIRVAHDISADFVVGFVGSLRPWHDVSTAVSAVRHLRDIGFDVHLLVVGDGPGRGHDDEAVTFVGSVGHEEVPAHMAAMDAVLVPYASDGEVYFSPLKLFEAMAMGRPVIGARTGQVREIIVDGVTGFTYEPSDPVDLAARVRAVAGLADRGRSVGDAARQWILDGRTWDDTARTIEQAVESAMEQRNELMGAKR